MKKTAAGVVALMLVLCLSAELMVGVRGEDPYLFFTWNVTYGTLSPLEKPQQVILIRSISRACHKLHKQQQCCRQSFQ